MVRRIVRSLFSLLPVNRFYSGVGHILMFHSVLPERNDLRIANDYLEVTPDHLEKVIRFFLEKGYQILSLDEMVLRLTSGKKGSKFVVFTFDDGYLDNLTYAYPVFKKYNLPFAIYITTNFPDYRTIIWWYPLEQILRSNEPINFCFKGVSYSFQISTIEQKKEAFVRIRSLIQQCNERDKEDILNVIFQPYDIDLSEMTQKMVLTWQQIKTLSDDPLVTIGAHTVNHFRLGALSSAEAKWEISDSLRIIEKRIGKKVAHFSFPFGTRNDVGEREFEIARSCGLITAATTRSANLFSAHKHYLHSLPRINIDMLCGEKELERIVNGKSHLLNFKGKRVITD